MLSRKILFPAAAIAMAAFVACGDDNSSSADSKGVPATLKNYVDTKDVVCSTTENFCAKIYIEEDLKDTVQCNGTSWEMMVLGKDVKGCVKVNNEDPQITPVEHDAGGPADAGNTPADTGETVIDYGETPPHETVGDIVSCTVPGVLGGCEEAPAGTDQARFYLSSCVSVLEGTLGGGCSE